MKRIFIILFIVLIILSGCNNDISKKEDLVEKVERLEINEYKIMNLKINYEEYIENTKDIMPDDYNNNFLDNITIYFAPRVNDDTVTVGDLKGISDEEFKEHKEEFKKYGPRNFEYQDESNEVILKISKPYDVSGKEENVVFARKIITFDIEKLKEIDTELKDVEATGLTKKIYLNRMYTFKKENNDWKLKFRNEDMKLYSLEEFEEINEEDLNKSLPFNEFQDEKVEYNTQINITNTN
ncbi:MAG: hypothetical protein ACTHVE_08720 [Senegalia sp. (in: firmicutes)]|uniref:hypothetical protein n=1 Tax=Senegalia sp. (in: firmicutes) TaxID=1924098 RepID=UPI003F987F5C